MSSISAIAIEVRPGLGQSTRRPSGAQEGTGGYDMPSRATLGGADTARLDRLVVLGEIATLLAQEVKNPLGAMLLNAKAALNWLSVEQPNLDQARQAITDIVESGRVARELIAIIDSLARAQAGEKRALDVNDAVLASVRVSRGETRRRGVSVRTHLSPGLPVVEGDCVQLQQVLLDLIRNAAQAMHDAVDQPREILVTTEAVANGVLVAVRDRRPRFDPETADRLFDPSYPADPGHVGGSLAHDRSIVEAHGGLMCAVANNPRGAVVQFVLPAQAA